MSSPAPAHQHIDWYSEPSWYDIIHAPGTARECDGLERIAHRFGRAASRLHVLEPACGTGRYLRTLAGRGHSVEGFDSVDAMVRYATRRFEHLDIPRRRWRIIAGDMRRFTAARRADLAICTINTLRHLATDLEVIEHFRCIASALKPGGIYAVGINTCRYGATRPSEDIWAGARGTCRVTQVIRYLPPHGPPESNGRRPERARIERVRSRLIVQTPTARRECTAEYALRTYSLREWRSLIGRSPMRVVGVVDDTGRDLAPFDALGPTREPPGGDAMFILTPRDPGRANPRAPGS